MVRNNFPHYGTNKASCQGSDDKKPKLGNRASALEKCGTYATCGIYRCPGNGNTHDMHKDKCQPDDQTCQFTGPFLFIRGSQRHENKNKREYCLGDKGL